MMACLGHDLSRLLRKKVPLVSEAGLSLECFIEQKNIGEQ